MAFDEETLKRLPIVPALGFAVRCAVLARPYFEKLWVEDYLNDSVEGALHHAKIIASSPRGTPLQSPDGYADHCVDAAGFAETEGRPDSAAAASAAAGATYCACMIADVYNGYSSQVPSYYYANIMRAANTASEIGPLAERVEAEFEALSRLVETAGLEDYSPATLEQLDNGFE